MSLPNNRFINEGQLSSTDLSEGQILYPPPLSKSREHEDRFQPFQKTQNLTKTEEK